MSGDPTGTGAVPEETPGLVLGADPAASLGSIMEFLLPEEDDAPAGEGAAEAGAAAAGDGLDAASAEGAGGAGGSGEAPAAGDGGVAPVAGEPAAGAAAEPADGAGSAAGPGVGELDATSLSEKWGEVATSFETSQEEFLRGDVITELREELPQHFEAIEKHPRELIGQKVQSVTDLSKTEVLRDEADAASWKEAMKRLLVQEVASRVSTRQEELRPQFQTVHASIDLFRNNVDLVPNTKQFDAELANRFVSFAKEYEVRSGAGKLIGWSVPVQPLINQLRSQLAAEKASKAAPAAPAAPTPQQQRAAEQQRTPAGQFAPPAPAPGPQAGITSKAGSAADVGPSDAEGVLSAFLRQNGHGGFSI